MARLRFKADRIFTGTAMADAGSVLVMREDGTVEDIVPTDEAGEEVRHLKGTLCPGFVNAHCHLELSHLKGRIAEGGGLVPFLKEVVSMRESDRVITESAMREAEHELYVNGVQAVGDVCNSADTIEVKSQSLIRWTNFIEVLCLTDRKTPERISHYKTLRERFRAIEERGASDHVLWRSNLSPHAPYSISPLCFQSIDAETEGQVVTLHNQETAGEDELYRTGSGPFLSLFERLGEKCSPLPVTGKSSLQSVLPHFKGRQSLILVHNTFTSREDLAFADTYSDRTGLDIHYCLCPNANLYIEGRLPPVRELMSGDRNLVIGTDSYGSNRQLDVASEIRTLMERVEGLDLEMVLRWATLNGAKALRRDDELGSFEKRKKPGLVLLDENLRATRLM